MDPSLYVKTFVLIGVVYSIVLHEIAHALAALWCGDPTAQRLGRITLNPIPHLDPIGSIVLPLLGALGVIPFFGWAKPVPVNPFNYRKRVLGDVVVSLAGIAVNLTIAFMVLLFTDLCLRLGFFAYDSAQITVFRYIALANIFLALFNLLPVPPLDGHHVMKYLLPAEMRGAYQSLGMMGILVVVLLLQIPVIRLALFSAVSLLRNLMGATVDGILSVLGL
ncbi:MAG: site-2 protease family protein [Planctomycetota bacterium]